MVRCRDDTEAVRFGKAGTTAFQTAEILAGRLKSRDKKTVYERIHGFFKIWGG
ncbi:hypothetical protein ACFOQN_07825 [Neisseria musculi]